MSISSLIRSKKKVVFVLFGVILIIFLVFKILYAVFGGYKTIEEYLDSEYSFKWEIVSEPEGPRNMFELGELVTKVKQLNGSNKGAEFYIVDDGWFKFHLQKDTYKETLKIKRLGNIFKKEYGTKLKNKGMEFVGFEYVPELPGYGQDEGVIIKVANSNFINLNDNSIKNIWDIFKTYIKFAEKHNFQYGGLFASSVENGDQFNLTHRSNDLNPFIANVPKTYDEFINTIIGSSETLKVRVEEDWNFQHPYSKENLIKELEKRGYHESPYGPIVENLGNPHGVNICVEGPYGEKEVINLINYLNTFEAPVYHLQINATNNAESEFNFYFNKIFNRGNSMTKEGKKYIHNELENE